MRRAPNRSLTTEQANLALARRLSQTGADADDCETTMPLYAFHCPDCRNGFETLARMDETPACPACGSAKAERQISLIAKPASGGDASEAPTCAGMSGGTPCGAGCPAFGGGA
jgi:putative FmdB family regulatory protein